jgi:catabolite repression HPr-like protein
MRLQKNYEQVNQLIFINHFEVKGRGERNMVEQQVEVLLKTGLQARPAALFVQEANRFSSDIYIEKDGKKVNAKSIMGLMSLAVSSGSVITLIADGPDEKEALEALTKYVQKEG